MNPNQASVKLSYDKVKDGLFSIKLRICFQQQRPRYHLPIKEGILVKPETYKRLVTFHQTGNERTAQPIRQLYALVVPFFNRAETIIASLNVFSFEEFERQFYNQATVSTDAPDLLAFLRQQAQLMNQQDRIGMADAYTAAAGSLERFIRGFTDPQRLSWLGERKQPERILLPFERLTPTLLAEYERWMLTFGSASRKKGGTPTPASITTIGIYLRQVRAAYNEAIKAGLTAQEHYPFGKKDFVIPTGANTKKALRKSVIKQIMTYSCEPGSFEERSRDLWVLSYLSNGMNLTDICKLRWSQIDYAGETITFVRGKTSRSRRGNQTQVVASLFPESKAIIERWGTGVRSVSGYVFPFLSADMDARRQKEIIKQVIKVTNKYMTLIGQALGITSDFRTYAARHSFASALLKSGADAVYIKDKLGQSSLKSTESYLVTILDEDEQSVLRKSLLDD